MQRPVTGTSRSRSSRPAPPFRRWLKRLSRAAAPLGGPLGGELLGPEALAERARAIAGAQQTTARPRRGTPLLERLDATRRILIDAHARISRAASGGEVGPAGEWLLDNFYVVLDHISEVRQNLPRGYYRELPSLGSGPLTGYPRVYELAIALISHTEARLDLEVIGRFTTAFQEVTPLNIGELWALPAMLRLALVESVRRMTLRTVQRLDQFDAADRWALRLHAAELAGTEALAAEVTDFSRSHPAATPEFVSRLHQQLRLQSSRTAIDWVQSWLEDEGHGAEEEVARSTQRLALTQVTMANSITSLRTVGGLDWPAFVEAHSRLEAVLRTDPAGVYPRMTFETRDGYRHVLEKLARRTRADETAVALRTVSLSADAEADSPRRHVGFFLVDDGVDELEHALQARPSFADRLRRAVRRHPTLALGLGTTVGMAVCLVLLLWLAGPEARQAWPAVLLLGLLPAHELALQTLQQLVTQFLPPRRLPKLDFLETATVPPEFATAVVVPTLFPSVGAVERALEHLEVEFLANRGPNLKFIVLSDFTDAPTETVPGDAEIVAAAQAGVRELEARYGDGKQSTFYLLHRARQWNPAQGVWMGWERKRGKLAQLNRLVLGADGSAFAVTLGDLAELRAIRFVITLDSDTLLPPDTAPLLIGALAHPLNRAVFDPVRERVVRGYAILQPRVGVSLPSANRTLFASIVSGEPGVDPYTTAVSDVYQDLYDEGSFAGKGIYDVEAFERATRDRFPDNRLLSHDLIEGGFARAGLVTDIKVYDDFPSRYLTWTARKHRWIRGDWQLLRWMMPRVPGPGGMRRNPLSLLSRWKIFDNLRRSMLELSQVALLVVGWTLLPGSSLRWAALTVLAVGAPWILNVLLAAVQPPLDRSWRAYYVAVGHDTVVSARQALFTIAFLPHQAWISADAILRTLWRLGVSRRNLLEWRTASHAERSHLGSARDLWRSMWPTVALTAGLLVLLVRRWVEAPDWQTLSLEDRTAQFLGCGLLGVLWLTAPWLAHRLNASPVRSERRLVPKVRTDALRYALLHWNYFRRFVTAETHWLAPDNFQETPVPVVAMRTSPTNIGLQLLATVSAHDLGFVTLEEMLTRVERVFASLTRMRRFRGHFLNWYDLKTLEDMAPGYISTVDSGNLAGHLIALRQACLGAADEPVLDRRIWPAVRTALALAQETALPPLADRLELVRSELGSVAERMDVAATLAEARSLLEETLRAAEAGTANAWIAWAAGRIDESSTLIDGLVPTGAPSREGVQPRFPSWRQCAVHSPGAAALVARLEAVASECDRLVTDMEFGFLYDAPRALFAIGYQLTSHTLDTSHYDLLASEARLASFVAIAKNDVPVEHWFHLGRELTRAAGATALMSWSGTMFEYLMPALVMRSFPFTLLDQTYQGAVHRQIAFASSRGVPWGISECAYNLRDHAQTYQYRTFGVPDLALKRGLDADLVVAPYASALAALVEPTKALTNLRLLERRGALGPYGFRDALDFTRPIPGQAFAVVENYMAHHLGMGLVALTNALTADRWQDRFHADPLVRAAQLLLHERIPYKLVFQEPQAARAEAALPDPELERPAVRQYDTPDTPTPRVALLGRLPYTIMVTNAGSGYSRLGDLAVTRWRADGTTDASGQFCYLRDVTSGRVWSSAHQPTCIAADSYQAALANDRVIFHRTDGHFETRTEITTAPDDSAEVRRVTVTNNGSRPAEVELTSYGEWVLAPPNADRAHPAFGNLFVETEWHAWCQAITATRRPRSAGEPKHYGVHVIALPEDAGGAVTFETDRARFLGRGRSVRYPAALGPGAVLGGGVGAVLDPIFALRTRLRLLPGRSASVAFTTAVLGTPEQAFDVADRYRDPRSAQRALDLAWTTAQIELRELATTSADAALYETLAGDLFFSDPRLRAPEPELLRNTGSQPLLWSIGVSGDWPIVLATVDSLDGLPTVAELLRAHRYWRRRGMTVDLVLLNTRGASYVQDLTEKLTAAVRASSEAPVNEQPGGVVVRRKDLLRPEEMQMLRATARVHVACDGRKLGQIVDPGQVDLRRAAEEAGSTRGPLQRLGIGLADRLRVPTPGPEKAARVEAPEQTVAAVEPPDRPSLQLDNGFGGLAEDGAYEIRLGRSGLPPAPWSNVVASEAGGFLVTERGGGFNWAGSSYFFRLTPWHNDPVRDPVGDVLYLRDEETRALWSATPGPCSTGSGYTVRHLPGLSTFTHQHEEISVELTMGLDERVGAKVSRLRLQNTGNRARRLSVTAYVEWALGPEREHTQHQVRTEFDLARGAIFARNTFDPQFASWLAFCAMSPRPEQHTGNRREFLGRNGSAADPAGLRNPSLAGRTGEGVDPCAALKRVVELAPDQSIEVTVVLGACPSRTEAQAAVDRLLDPTAPERTDLATVSAWEERLSAVRVSTPDRAFDALMNRWLLYQALSCRMWGRSALYQSGGAYGFRDQLQDSMAFLLAAPGVSRAHLLRAAARQFEEGDVQHWWHPESGRGVRTRLSDDLAWLPFVAERYVQVTGDAAVLDVEVPFLSLRPLRPDELELYELPSISPHRGTLYEHCRRALRKACTTGAHGLPLIGTGDWNDGMNRVGVEGRGESVWLAWFLVSALRSFAPLASQRGEASEAAWMLEQADAYVTAVEEHGWDGAWYRRAFFDDGTPLGSASSEQCRIDSIAQSWSVISGAGRPERQDQAMRSLRQHLVDPRAGLIALLTPPFDRARPDPGYIQGYLPGVRENGAQYTHAALWAVLAMALQKDGDLAFEHFQMLNPLTHALSPETVATYKVEPYVVAADVYTAATHLGRGGWTWYTGSASWMYRVGLEAILGFTKEGTTLRMNPCVPRAWTEFRIEYRYGTSRYVITASRAAPGVSPRVLLDGAEVPGGVVPLSEDGGEHLVSVSFPTRDQRMATG
jgi:cyclic beta-1,2-glucan synthetase